MKQYVCDAIGVLNISTKKVYIYLQVFDSKNYKKGYKDTFY